MKFKVHNLTEDNNSIPYNATLESLQQVARAIAGEMTDIYENTTNVNLNDLTMTYKNGPIYDIPDFINSLKNKTIYEFFYQGLISNDPNIVEYVLRLIDDNLKTLKQKFKDPLVSSEIDVVEQLTSGYLAKYYKYLLYNKDKKEEPEEIEEEPLVQSPLRKAKKNMFN